MSEFDSLPAGRPFLPSTESDEPDDDLLEIPSIAPERPLVSREGLPPGYRMRNDAHYVDQIAAGTPVRLVAIKSIDALNGRDAKSAGLEDLTRSIGALGILQPLHVRNRNGRYELIAGAKRLAAARLAGLAEVPCFVHHMDDARARALAEADNLRLVEAAAPARPAEHEDASISISMRAVQELAPHLETVASCLGLLSEARRPLRERMPIALASMEAQRGVWLARGVALLSGGAPMLVLKALDADAFVRKFLDRLTAERRLSDVDVALEVTEPRLRIRADEPLLSLALAGLVEAMLALLDKADGGRLAIRLAASPSREETLIELSQSAISVPASALGRFLDLQWAERPGGFSAGIGLVAAERAAEHLGGRLEVSAADRGGVRLTLALPSA